MKKLLIVSVLITSSVFAADIPPAPIDYFKQTSKQEQPAKPEIDYKAVAELLHKQRDENAALYQDAIIQIQILQQQIEQLKKQLSKQP